MFSDAFPLDDYIFPKTKQAGKYTWAHIPKILIGTEVVSIKFSINSWNQLFVLVLSTN